MLPSSASDDCDDCVPEYLRSASNASATVLITTLPFWATFVLVAGLSARKLFPRLAGPTTPGKDHHHERLPFNSPNYDLSSKSPSNDTKLRIPSIVRRHSTVRDAAALVFATLIGLSGVLAQLILCEITNILDPRARSLTLRLTLPALLALLILITPALQIYTILRASGWEFWPRLQGSNRTQRKKTRSARLAWVLELLGLGTWLLCFWWLGQGGMLGRKLSSMRSTLDHSTHTYNTNGDSSTSAPSRLHAFSEGCLERLGVIGIALMATLAGFAAVSALWHTFGTPRAQRKRPVSESDISRRQGGLDATREMLASKSSRLRALQRKFSEQGDMTSPRGDGLMGRMLGSVMGRGTGSETQEMRALEFEIAGLETMAQSLSDGLIGLQARRQQQLRAATPTGRLFTAASWCFAVYCGWRIGSTSLAMLKRWFFAPASSSTTATIYHAAKDTLTGASSSDAGSTSDPVTFLLTLLATYYDPTLDRAAWSRAITFLLSAVMLLAPFNAVLQTVLLFARLTPTRLRASAANGSNIALLVGQTAATYTISAALLLRSNLPGEVRGVVSEVLGAPLEAGFVEGWFEGWFFLSVLVTGVGVLVGRKIAGGEGEEGDEEGGVEMGKMS